MIGQKEEEGMLMGDDLVKWTFGIKCKFLRDYWYFGMFLTAFCYGGVRVCVRIDFECRF